jgi:hypothetical protein
MRACGALHCIVCPASSALTVAVSAIRCSRYMDVYSRLVWETWVPPVRRAVAYVACSCVRSCVYCAQRRSLAHGRFA